MEWNRGKLSNFRSLSDASIEQMSTAAAETESAYLVQQR
jgi:hypothetical protein